MGKFLIGFGGWNKYFLYILGTTVFKCLRDCIFGFNTINPESKIGLFGFIPELSNHFLIQSLFRYFSFILGGALFIYILNRKISDNVLTKKIELKNQKGSLLLNDLIFNRKSDGSEIARMSHIFKVCLIYCVHAELSRIMYLFDFSGLDFWTIDVVFVLIFMNKYFIINFYKHQKYSMGFIIIFVSILLLISSLLPMTYHKDEEEKKSRDKNTYQIIKDITGSYFSSIPIFFIFCLIACLISYQRVQEKVLMDFYYLSPYRLIFYIGILGFILTSIILAITSSLYCRENKKYITEHCYVAFTQNNETKHYYDNVLAYFDELKKNKHTYKLYLEIILIPPLYIIINFLEFCCEILTINYLNPNFVLVRDNIYYGTSRLIFFYII